MADTFFTRAPSTIVTISLTGQLEFTIPFEYLARKYVEVTLLGVNRLPLVLNTDYRFVNKTLISLTQPYGAEYEKIELRRVTSATERLVDFYDGSILRAYDLNLSQIQALHVAEEARDSVSLDGMGISDDFNLDARGRRIKNLADAVDETDAISKRQLRLYDDSALISAERALQYRNESERFMLASQQAAEASGVIIIKPTNLSTIFDNTTAINEALTESRLTGKTVKLPQGRWPVLGTLELGGVKVQGVSVGYRNTDGTVLTGDGTNTLFNQSVSTFPYYANTRLEGLRIENVLCGIEFGYLNRAEFVNIHIDSVGTGIRFGRATNSGPQWNTLRHCTVEALGSTALYMNGAAWCNNNVFELCFFESKDNGTTPAVVIDCAGGYGAIDNLFIATEVASDGFGVRLKNAKATTFESCYMECKGPAIWMNGTSKGTRVEGGVFARQRNDNVTGINWAIYHESGNADITLNKPYYVVSDAATQDGCGLVGYKQSATLRPLDTGVAAKEAPANFVVNVVSDPIGEVINNVSYTRYADGLFGRVTTTQHGDLIVQSDSRPSLSLQYEDGTKKVELYSNSVKGLGDYGTVLKVNDTTRMQFTVDNKLLLPNQRLGLVAEKHTAPAGGKTHRIQVATESGGFLGYLTVTSS